MAGSQIPAAEAAALAGGKSNHNPSDRKPPRRQASGHRGSGDDEDPFPHGEPMLTLHQAAANLHVDVRTIQRLVEAGDLLAIRFGPNTTRIPKSSYDELIARAVKRSLEARAS